MIREIAKKDSEQEVLLEGMERLVTKISSQNVENMNLYNMNMTVLVNSLKDSFKKDGSSVTSAGSTFSSAPKTAKLTKLAKVPS